MVRVGEIEHGELIAPHAETVWNWSSPAGQLRAKRRGRLVAEAASLGPGVRALEIGCGTGLFTEMFVAAGADVVAIDISEPLLDQARDRELGERATFMCADAEALSFDDGSFDAVVGSSVLHHLDVSLALPELARVLKPGGVLALAEPNMMNPQIALQRNVPMLREWAGESPEETAFVRWRLRREMTACGFEGVSIEPFDFLHPATPKALIPLVRGMGGALERLPVLREIAGSLMIRGVRGASV